MKALPAFFTLPTGSQPSIVSLISSCTIIPRHKNDNALAIISVKNSRIFFNLSIIMSCVNY